MRLFAGFGRAVRGGAMLGGAVLLAAVWATALAACAGEGSYTNHAGYVLRGMPVGVTADAVVFQLADGDQREVPLSVFPAAEQRRLRADAGAPMVPPELADYLRVMARTRARNDVRLRDGHISRETYDALAAEEAARLKAVVERLRAEGVLTDAEAAVLPGLKSW